MKRKVTELRKNPPSNEISVNDRDELLLRIQELEERCRRAEDAVRTVEERDRLLGDSAPFGIFVVDPEGRVFGANQKMLDMWAWPEDRNVTNLNILKHPPLVDSGVADVFHRCMEKRIRVTSDHPCPSNTDRCTHLRYYISPVIDIDERFSGIIAFVEDITELKLAEESIIASEQRFREQAMQDNLTGLYNRRYLYQTLTDLIERDKTDGSVVSVIFMDLDRFKVVVDTYGHLNGSRVIKEVAKVIQKTLEKPAYAVAYAGDEFVVVLPDFEPAQAMEQAQKIQTQIKNHVFLRDQGYEVSIQSSFGIATFPYHAEDMTNLLAKADHALFSAKGSGKDSIKSFG
jgi:diguanylate cyclase (GGDEF)-like protein/PAS domain S-box-containing protein